MIVRVAFKNSGQTPAYDVNIKGGMILAPFPGKIANKDVSHHVYAPNVVLPGGEMFKEGTGQIPKDRLEGLRAGREVLSVFGNVSYLDAFGDHHYCSYSLILGGRQTITYSMKDGERLAHLAPAETGNASD